MLPQIGHETYSSARKDNHNVRTSLMGLSAHSIGERYGFGDNGFDFLNWNDLNYLTIVPEADGRDNYAIYSMFIGTKIERIPWREAMVLHLPYRDRFHMIFPDIPDSPDDEFVKKELNCLMWSTVIHRDEVLIRDDVAIAIALGFYTYSNLLESRKDAEFDGHEDILRGMYSFLVGLKLYLWKNGDSDFNSALSIVFQNALNGVNAEISEDVSLYRKGLFLMGRIIESQYLAQNPHRS